MNVFDFRWDDKKEKPYFQYIEDNKSKSKKILKNLFLNFDTPFFLTVTDEKMKCMGSMQKQKYVSCSQNEIGKKKCEICKKSEDYFPCQFCNGFNCERFRNDKIENCDADHMVYLALFSDNIVKIGVSRLSRMKARQYEQGTHYTRILAQGISGVTARRIEHFVGKLGFPDKITASRKKDILFPCVPLEKGKQILEEKYQFAKENIHHQMPEMMKYIVENEFWDMRSFYANDFDFLEKSHKAVHYLDLKEGESVGGVLKGVKGAFLLIETPTELVVILAKKLAGKEISFDECEEGISKIGGFQGGLF